MTCVPAWNTHKRVGSVTEGAPAPSMAPVTPRMPCQYVSPASRMGTGGMACVANPTLPAIGRLRFLASHVGSGLYSAAFMEGKQQDFHFTFKVGY